MHVIVSLTNCDRISHELRHLRGLAAARLARDDNNSVRLEPSGVSICTYVPVKQVN